MSFCPGCLIQDGRLTAIYGRNLFLAITRYWIEILTSNFVCWHFKIKSYDFCQGRLIQDGWQTAIYGQSLFLAITRYCIEMLARICRQTGGGIPSDALRRILGSEFSAFHWFKYRLLKYDQCVLLLRHVCILKLSFLSKHLFLTNWSWALWPFGPVFWPFCCVYNLTSPYKYRLSATHQTSRDFTL